MLLIKQTAESPPLPFRPDAALSPDPKAVQICCDWLSFHRLWGNLSDGANWAIAHALQLLKVEAGTELYRMGQRPLGVYLLKWGTVEIYRQSLVGMTHILYRSAGELFGYVTLVNGQADATYQTSAIARSACEIWFLSYPHFAELLQTYPELQQLLNRQLAQDVLHFSQRMEREQARIQGLQPYLQPLPVQATLIGSSKASQKLAQQIDLATRDRKPILLQAPPGTGKTFLAGFVHLNSGLNDRPFAEINCAQLPRNEAGMLNTDPLFGKEPEPETEGERPQWGVIELLERGTLLIDNVQLLSVQERDRLTEYLKTGLLTRNSTQFVTDTPQPVEAWVRLILASPRSLTLPGIEAHNIKLFSLPQRKEDIPEFARQFLAQACREWGRSPLELDQANLRRLISYHYPGNLVELAGVIKRAVTMTPPEQTVIPEQVLWSMQSSKNAFRIDLLNQLPWLRRLLLSQGWPERVWWLVMGIFVPVTVLGFIGPQTREASLTLNLFWAWWWPFYLLFYLFVGRIWCAVCPFMITGEWVRKLSLWLWPRRLLPWPTTWMNRWGGWVLFGGFVAIYLWEKLWDLPHTPYLSAWLLVIIAAGAVVGSVIYERRLWCRYLCPIGGMNGMFAKLSIIEVRSTQQVCGSQCSSFGCYKGSGATPVKFADALPTEGQATGGCPLYSHPAQLQDNRDCVLCMTCLKACPNRSVVLNLRFPATDLLENHRGSWPEVALLLLLLGGVVMHHSDRILQGLGLSTLAIDADHLGIGLPIVVVLLSIPAALTYLAHRLVGWLEGFGSQTSEEEEEVRLTPDYPTLIYAYLPFTLTANLAHYIPAAITEAGQILPVVARTFGASGAGWPTLTWSSDVAAFLQGMTLLAGFGFSIYPLLQITQHSWLRNLPHLILMAALTLLFFQLML